MKKIVIMTAAAGLIFLSLSPLWGGGKAEASLPEIVVASKIDTEGALLGSMIVQMLNANGFKAVDKTEFGTTDVIRTAIKNGEIDIYPEYTGNGGFFYPDSPRDVWKVPAEAYAAVKRLDKNAADLDWLKPAPANNTWALAVRTDLARSAQLKTLSDFGRYAASGGKIKLAASEEFMSRPDALPAFEAVYGFKLRKDQTLVLSGGNTATTEKAAADGTDGVNVSMAYGTDGQLAALGLVVLEDDKNVQPVYEPAPIVRGKVLSRYPAIREVLEPVFAGLDLVTLQTLNSRIAVQGLNAKDVARDYLKGKGLLK